MMDLKYPEWLGDGERRTRLSLDFARRLQALRNALGDYAWSESNEGENDHPLWDLMDQHMSVLHPVVMSPLDDGRWNPRGLFGCLDGPLGEGDEYLPEFYDVLSGDDISRMTVLHARLVVIDADADIT